MVCSNPRVDEKGPANAVGIVAQPCLWLWKYPVWEPVNAS